MRHIWSGASLTHIHTQTAAWMPTERRHVQSHKRKHTNRTQPLPSRCRRSHPPAPLLALLRSNRWSNKFTWSLRLRSHRTRRCNNNASRFTAAAAKVVAVHMGNFFSCRLADALFCFRARLPVLHNLLCAEFVRFASSESCVLSPEDSGSEMRCICMNVN